jgi:transposase
MILAAGTPSPSFTSPKATPTGSTSSTKRSESSWSAVATNLQALHRVRERFVGQRTGIINQIRAFMLERGIAVRQGLRFLRAELPGILATRPMRCRPACCASSRTYRQIGAAWTRAFQ